jgi:hypothetical protein
MSARVFSERSVLTNIASQNRLTQRHYRPISFTNTECVPCEERTEMYIIFRRTRLKGSTVAKVNVTKEQHIKAIC